jgi:hypothetical protein
MKLAVLSESAADEAAVRILVDGLLGGRIQLVGLQPLRTRGESGVFGVLPAVLKDLHFQSDAEALVVVVDSDHSPVHVNSHEQPEGEDEHCRLCKLRQVVAQVRGQLRPITGRLLLKVALGLAVPAIEAWYRCGIDPHVTEATWVMSLQSRSSPYTKSRLKQDVYGTDRPPLTLEMKRATEEAQRLVKNLDLLARLFPGGFGFLAREVQSW